MEADFLGSLERIKSIGFDACEFAGLGGLDAARVRGALDRLGLGVAGMHIGIDWESLELGTFLDEAKALGSDQVVIPWVPEAEYGSGWMPLAQKLESLRERAAGEGVRLAYHHHDFELAMENGKSGLEILYDNSSVDAQLDVYWLAYAGHDPALWIRRLAGRMRTVHLKDGILGGKPRFCPLGKGELDWDAILEACFETGVEIGIIEQDVCEGDPFEQVELSLKFLRTRAR